MRETMRMAGIDIATAQANLDAALDALEAARALKASELGGRRSERHGLQSYLDEVNHWDRLVKRLSRGTGVSAQRGIVHG